MKLIDRQPLREETSEVWTPDGIALVKPFQIVVMVSLSIGDVLEPGGRRFPAILDTGLNHNFAIRREHLDRWTALRPPTRKPVTHPEAGDPFGCGPCLAVSQSSRARIPRRTCQPIRPAHAGGDRRLSGEMYPTRLGCRSSASAPSCGAT